MRKASDLHRTCRQVKTAHLARQKLQPGPTCQALSLLLVQRWCSALFVWGITPYRAPQIDRGEGGGLCLDTCCSGELWHLPLK